MWRTRALEAGVGVAAVLSTGMLAMMLAAPFVTRPAWVAPTDSAAPSPSTADPTELPIGLFQLRGRLMFSGPCLGIQLTDASYPVDAEDHGSATVIWWQPTAADSGNPSACASRAGELREVSAAVRALSDEGDPDAPPIGYAIDFRVPIEGIETNENIEIAIILDRSTADHVQALVIRPQGVPGLTFDRVDAIDPPFEARPSAPPVAVLPPNGIYLLRYPLGSDGPCVVIELGQPSFPVERSAEGTARIRSWEPWVRDANDPAQCLTRRGEIHETEGTVVAVRDSSDVVIAYHIIFSVTLSGALQTMEISFDPAQPRPGRLEATAIKPPDVGRLDFDRVDSIDPPLGTGG